MTRRHRADLPLTAANIAAASGDECVVLLNELVLVYVADDFLIEDAEERWTCRWKFSVFLRSFSISAFMSPAEHHRICILAFFYFFIFFSS